MILATVGFIVFSVVIPINKIFFITATFYILSLLYITQSIQKTFLFAFVPLGMIVIGQVYVTTVIPFSALATNSYPEGRQFYFRFSPFLVLLLSSIVVFVAQAIKQRGKLFLGIEHLFVFAGLFFSGLSALKTEHFPILSLLTTIQATGIVCWVLNCQFLLRNLVSIEKTKLLRTFLFIVILMATVQNFVALGQYLKRSTLGIYIEQSTVIPTFGTGADENSLSFRPIGLQTHANDLANSELSLLFTVAVLLCWLSARKQELPWWFITIFFGVSGLVLLLTQSRAAYIAIAIGLIVLFLVQKKAVTALLSVLQQKLRPLIPFFILGAIYLVPLVTERLLYSIYSFGFGGGITTRRMLEKQAFALLQAHPFYGVGPSMFIPAAFKQDPEGIIKWFPESVHNGFLLLLVENGSVAFVFFIGFLYFLVRAIILSRLDSFTKAVIRVGFVSTFILMFFHPFDNLLSFLVLTSWILVYIQDTNYYEKA